MNHNADAAAVTSWAGLGISLATANELAQLVGSCVAIVAGCLAIALYIQRLRRGGK